MRILSLSTLAILGLFSATLFAQEKESHVIDLFEGEEAPALQTKTKLVIESNNTSDFGSVSGRPGFELKFQRGGNGIFVAAKINSKKVYFLFDTGATTTTLNPTIAKAARVFPAADAPLAMMQTANGSVGSQFGVIGNLNLGGRPHFNVSFALCEACPSGKFKGRPIAGLLGMNVIGRYRASIDDEKGVVEMMPLKGFNNRIRDIRPFLRALPIRGVQDRGHVKITVMLQNLSEFSIKKLNIELTCSDKKKGQKTLGLKGHSKKRVSIKIASAKCGQPSLDILYASW